MVLHSCKYRVFILSAKDNEYNCKILQMRNFNFKS